MTEKTDIDKIRGVFQITFDRLLQAHRLDLYIRENLPYYIRKSEDIPPHVLNITLELCNHYLGTLSSDEFVQALAKEDFVAALAFADDMNKVAIYFYHIFITNNVPIGIRRHYKEEPQQVELSLAKQIVDAYVDNKSMSKSIFGVAVAKKAHELLNIKFG